MQGFLQSKFFCPEILIVFDFVHQKVRFGEGWMKNEPELVFL